MVVSTHLHRDIDWYWYWNWMLIKNSVELLSCISWILNPGADVQCKHGGVTDVGLDLHEQTIFLTDATN